VAVFDVASGARLWRTHDAEGDVNALVFDGSHLVAATGSIEDRDGDRVAVANYVRVFDAGTGVEVARSHDHGAPVLALVPERRLDGVPPRLAGLAIGSDHFLWTLP
jgi:hypothetical protein